MAKGIFVSSASPDGAIVRGMLSRLRDLGLDPPADVDLPRIWHYEKEMEAGNFIFETVRDAIDQSSVAVLCLSDNALSRPWIVSEATLLKQAIIDRRIERDRVIPIKVGPVSDDKLEPVHDFITSQDQFVADVSKGEETELAKLAGQIHAKLGINAPKVLAIAMFAMTKTQAADLIKNWQQLTAAGQQTPVSRICETVGLRPPQLFDLIASRYGDRPEDLMPFRDESVMQLVHRELNEANCRRVLNNDVPLFPRWVHGELLGDDVEQAERARQVWRENDSLLIVDSISTYKPELVARLGRIPDLLPQKSAVVCLPPYTRQTVALEEAFQDAFAHNLDASRLSEWFTSWRGRAKGPEQLLSFDIATSVSLGSWLERRFVVVAGKYLPQGRAINAMPKSSFSGSPTQ
jgi:hypothetical protein